MMDGYIEQGGKTYRVDSSIVYATGCSSVLVAINATECWSVPSIQSNYPTWEGAISMERLVRDHIWNEFGYSGRLTERLTGFMGWIVPEILKYAADKIPTNAWIMDHDGEPYAIMWSKSPVMLKKGVALPYYMLNPHKTCSDLWQYRQNVICEYESFRRGTEPKHIRIDAKTMAVGVSRDHISALDGHQLTPLTSFSKLVLRRVFKGRQGAGCVLTDETSEWNPEYSRLVRARDRSPWDSAEIAGKLWPTARVMFNSIVKFVGHDKPKKRIGVYVVGGNYGLESGLESCRVATYVHKLMEDKDFDFSVPHSHNGVYYSSPPWIYHSPQHAMNPVGCALFSRWPITWRRHYEPVRCS